MIRGKLAATVVALVGMICLAMASRAAPNADGQQSSVQAVAPKPSPVLTLPATQSNPPKARTAPAEKADKNVALCDRPTKPFRALDAVVDQVTQDLQRKIDADAKRIEERLMRQSQFRLGP